MRIDLQKGEQSAIKSCGLKIGKLGRRSDDGFSIRRAAELKIEERNAADGALLNNPGGFAMETFFQKVGRLRMARLQAEEQVMRETLPITEDDEAELGEATDE